jgi:hypothetical protein
MSKLLLLALVATLLGAGCSSDGDDAGNGAPTDEAAVETTTAQQTVPEQQPGVAEDLNDTGGPLDLEAASAVRTGDLLAVSLTTYEAWDDAVVRGPRVDRPGPNRLTVLYDIDVDGRADYTGKIIFAEGALSLVIAGNGQAFEPVPVERPDDATAQFIHPVDIFFIVGGQAEIESETEIQVAVESEAVGFKDRIPAEGWILVAFAP